MVDARDLFKQTQSEIEQLGLREIPFTESPIDLSSKVLKKVFTGRQEELKDIFRLLHSRERRRILISGSIGIGKSALMLEALAVIKEEKKKMLATYISLPAELDLATTALIALALEMPNDDWAQRQLYEMGIPTSKILKERESQASASLVFGGQLSEKDLPTRTSQYPTFSFNALLEKAMKKFPEGVLIAIDDLDKQNPSRVRELMHDAQGILKGKAWFMLTAHPIGMTSDLLTTERGLFDLQVSLKEMDEETTYHMLINYLDSARLKNNCIDPESPHSVLPFSPEAAREFCRKALGKPRLFNRLGSHILLKATELQVDKITSDILKKGLRAASESLEQQAALSLQEERIKALLQEEKSISDEDITLEQLESLGFKSFTEMIPFLERLEENDLAYRRDKGDETIFEFISLSED